MKQIGCQFLNQRTTVVMCDVPTGLFTIVGCEITSSIFNCFRRGVGTQPKYIFNKKKGWIQSYSALLLCTSNNRNEICSQRYPRNYSYWPAANNKE